MSPTVFHPLANLVRFSVTCTTSLDRKGSDTVNDLLADTSGIQATSGSIDEAASQAITLAGQVLATAESTVWQGQANAAFVEAVETFREQKDKLGQILTQVGGDVGLAAQDHDQNEVTQVSGMQAKAGMMA